MAHPKFTPSVIHTGSGLSRLLDRVMTFIVKHGVMLALLLTLALLGAALLLPADAFAQQAANGGIAAITSTPTAGGGQSYALNLQTLILLTALSFLPAALMMMTSFTRIIIVLSLLRQAIGTQSAPPNMVMVGLALFLTLFVMGPVFDKIYADAYQPLSENKITMTEALDRGALPLRGFMMKQTRQTDLALFAKMANTPQWQTPDDVPMRILIPAFVTSELKTAFQIGFAIFIPFLIIDMVVASVLMSMGMMMVSPAMVSLPMKLMLFVLVDGWHLIIGSLAQSFY
jgi:flagellar biosynthetic protein FliP